MLKKSLKVLGMIGILALLSTALFGCASMVSKSEWPVKFASTPDQADISCTCVDDGHKVFSGKTPTTVTLSSKGGFFKGKTYKVEISKDGYMPQTVEIRPTINGWYFGNILLGGLIGMLIVDPATGAMWTLDPQDINVTLEKKTAQAGDKEFSVVSLNDIPISMRDRMVRIK